MELLEYRWEEKRYRKWIGTQILVYAAALASYYVIWKLCLHLQGFAESTYQGINNIGSMGVGDLPGILVKILVEFMLFFLEWNFLKDGLTLYSFLNILFLAVFVTGILCAVWKSGCAKRRVHLVLMLLCLAALPVGCYICYLTSPAVFYHALMVQSICLLYILTAVIYERWCTPRCADLVLILLTAIILNNAVSANIGYTLMDQAMKRTQSAAAELSARIHMLDDGTIRYVAMYGSMEDWEEDASVTPGILRELGGWKQIDRSLISPMYLMTYADFDLAYYRIHDLEYPVVEFGPEVPAPCDWEFRFPMQSAQERDALYQTETVQNMPVWPHRDSVVAVGDTIVVKFSES